MTDVARKIVEERTELKNKIGRLKAFIDEKRCVSEEPAFDEQELVLLEAQYHCFEVLDFILANRIRLKLEKNELSLEDANGLVE